MTGGPREPFPVETIKPSWTEIHTESLPCSFHVLCVSDVETRTSGQVVPIYPTDTNPVSSKLSVE